MVMNGPRKAKIAELMSKFRVPLVGCLLEVTNLTRQSFKIVE